MSHKPPFIRSAYNYDRKQASDDSATYDFGPSLTVQEHAVDADINNIVARFGITGVMPDNHRVPQFGDFDGISDFRTALEAISAAEENFGAMPWEVRARFHNDPQEFLEFCAVEANLPEMRKLGLAVPEKVVDTTLADVVKAVKESNSGKGGDGK